MLQGQFHHFSSSEVTTVASDKSGNIYAAYGNTIDKVNSAGTVVKSYTSHDPKILEMYGVTVDKNGTVWGVSQTQGGATVYKLDSNLNVITTHFLAGGWATAYTIAVDNSGNLVISDKDIGRIHRVNTTTWSDTFYNGTGGLSVGIDNNGVFGPANQLYVGQGTIMAVTENTGAVTSTFGVPGSNYDALAFGTFVPPGVPEPGSVALMLGSGAIGTSLLLRRRRLRKASE